jgi:hypothetical protein
VLRTHDRPESLCAQPLTDSQRSSPLSGFGLDTVRLRGPATDELLRQLPEKRFSQMVDDVTGETYEAQRSGHVAIPVGETIARVRGDYRRGRPEIAIEFSAPSVLYGCNQEPLMVSLLTDVAEAVYDLIAAELSGMPPFETLWLNRLDADREFDNVGAIPQLLQAISLRRVTRARTDRLERGNDGQWQSLTRGNQSRWLAVGYDKGRQLAELSERTFDPSRRELLSALASTTHGRLRFELQLRRDRLREFGIRRLSDVDEDIIYAMTEQHFDRARFGELIAGGSQRLTAALAGLKAAEQRNVLAVLCADHLGLSAPMSHNVEDSARRLVRELGLAPDLLLGDEEEVRRLDFDSGSELRGPRAVLAGPPASLTA